MTQTLKYWCEQATRLGLDECHQRGLLFLLALDISVIEDGAGCGEALTQTKAESGRKCQEALKDSSLQGSIFLEPRPNRGKGSSCMKLMRTVHCR